MSIGQAFRPHLSPNVLLGGGGGFHLLAQGAVVAQWIRPCTDSQSRGPSSALLAAAVMHVNMHFRWWIHTSFQILPRLALNLFAPRA